MSRLIDADAFEKFIKDKYKDGESIDDIKDQILFDLSYQPTAYNTEAVVAELEELDANMYTVDNCKNECNDIDSNCHKCYLAKITEIVRKGGAE